MALREYLAGEIAADFGDGLLSRREALRRLGLLGLTAAAAGTALAACGSDGTTAKGGAPTSASGATTGSPAAPSAGNGSTTSSPAKRPSETMTFPGPAGNLQGAFSAASA